MAKKVLLLVWALFAVTGAHAQWYDVASAYVYVDLSSERYYNGEWQALDWEASGLNFYCWAESDPTGYEDYLWYDWYVNDAFEGSGTWDYSYWENYIYISLGAGQNTVECDVWDSDYYWCLFDSVTVSVYDYYFYQSSYSAETDAVLSLSSLGSGSYWDNSGTYIYAPDATVDDYSKTVSFASTGTYYVELRLSSDDTVIDSATFTITLPPVELVSADLSADCSFYNDGGYYQTQGTSPTFTCAPTTSILNREDDLYFEWSAQNLSSGGSASSAPTGYGVTTYSPSLSPGHWLVECKITDGDGTSTVTEYISVYAFSFADAEFTLPVYQKVYLAALTDQSTSSYIDSGVDFSDYNLVYDDTDGSFELWSDNDTYYPQLTLKSSDEVIAETTFYTYSVDIERVDNSFTVEALGFNGSPDALRMPMQEALSPNKKKSAIDAFSLRPTFHETDVSIPLPGSHLTLGIHRILSMRAASRSAIESVHAYAKFTGDHVMGYAWRVNIGGALYEDFPTCVVVDENGESFEFEWVNGHLEPVQSLANGLHRDNSRYTLTEQANYYVFEKFDGTQLYFDKSVEEYYSGSSRYGLRKIRDASGNEVESYFFLDNASPPADNKRYLVEYLEDSAGRRVDFSYSLETDLKVSGTDAAYRLSNVTYSDGTETYQFDYDYYGVGTMQGELSEVERPDGSTEKYTYEVHEQNIYIPFSSPSGYYVGSLDYSKLWVGPETIETLNKNDASKSLTITLDYAPVIFPDAYESLHCYPLFNDDTYFYGVSDVTVTMPDPDQPGSDKTVVSTTFSQTSYSYASAITFENDVVAVNNLSGHKTSYSFYGEFGYQGEMWLTDIVRSRFDSQNAAVEIVKRTYSGDEQQNMTSVTVHTPGSPAGAPLYKVAFDYQDAGNTTDAYEKLGLPAEMSIDPDSLDLNRTYTYDWDCNKPQTVTQTTGGQALQTRMAYTPQGKLQTRYSAYGSAVQTSEAYSYTTNGVLELVEDADGREREFDPSGNPWGYPAVERITMEDASVIEVVRDINKLGWVKAVTNANGEVVEYSRDALGRVTHQLNPVAAEGQGFVTNQFDGWGYLSFQKEHNLANGSEKSPATVKTHDALGRVIKERVRMTSPDVDDNAADIIIERRFNEYNLTEWERDPEGNEFEYQYDALNRLTHKIWKNVTVGHEGSLTCTTEDLTEQYIYTDNGAFGALNGEYKPSRIISVSGKAVDMKYDSAGRLVRKIWRFDDGAGLSPVTSGPRTGEPCTEYQRDEAGNVLVETQYNTNKDGQRVDQVAYTFYDRHLRPTAVVRDMDDDGVGKTAGTFVDLTTNTLTSTFNSFDGDDIVTLTCYDNAGNIIALCDANANITEKRYDNAGRLKQEILPQVEAWHPETGAYIGFVRPTIDYHRDGNGNILLETRNYGGGYTVQTRMQYDALDNLTNTITDLDRDGLFEPGEDRCVSYRYDLAGNLLAQTDANGNTTDFDYDRAFRQTHIIQPAVYDVESAGTLRPTTVTQFDKNGNPITVTDPRQTVTETVYDERNLARFVTADKGGLLETVTENQYDKAGNLLRTIDPLSNRTEHRYDAFSRLIRTFDLTGQETERGLDLLGNALWIEDGNGNRTWFATDRASRRTATTWPEIDGLSATQSVELDGLGNITRRTDANQQVTDYFYTPHNQLAETRYHPGETNRFSRFRRYTAFGDLVEVDDPGGRLDVAYTYDPAGRLLSETSAGVTHSYALDPNGNRTNIFYGNSIRSVAIARDALNRRSSVSEGSRTVTFGYGLNGNLRERSYPNGIIETRQFDDLNRLGTIGLSKSGSPLITTEYGYNAIGLATGKTETVHVTLGGLPQNASWSWQYDQASRLTNETISVLDGLTTSTVFAWDPAGNRLSKTEAILTNSTFVTTSTMSCSNNACNQLVWMSQTNHLTGESLATHYEYDPNGNRTRMWVENLNPAVPFSASAQRQISLFETDYRSRQVRRSVISGSESWVHQAMSFSDGLAVQEYALFSPTQQPAVNNLQTEFMRSEGLGGGVGGMLYSLHGGIPSYSHADLRGDVIARTDSSGAFNWYARYEAYGTRIDEWGVNSDPHRANTKPEEFGLGLLNEHNRYRDLLTGTFLTRDPLGYADGPNVYAYVHGNPITRFDPLGLNGSEITDGYSFYDTDPNFMTGEYALLEGNSFALAGDGMVLPYVLFDTGCKEVGNNMFRAESLGLSKLDGINMTLNPVTKYGVGLVELNTLTGMHLDNMGDSIDTVEEVNLSTKRFLGESVELGLTLYGAGKTAQATAPPVQSWIDDLAPNNVPARLPAGANNATVRLTQAGDEFLHYGYAEHAAGWKAGARPGTYAGTIEATSGANAQNLYNLPRWRSPPDSVYRITPPAGTPIQGPGRVMPAYGHDIQGLGTEFIFPQGTPAGSVSGPFPIRPR